VGGGGDHFFLGSMEVILPTQQMAVVRLTAQRFTPLRVT
jgi:hypothetical protein